MPFQLPPYPIYTVTVLSARLVTPHMKRITVDVSRIPSLQPTLPAQWLKVFVHTKDGALSGGRAYTVRRFDSATGMLDLDFVLHGDSGPVSAWAADARLGDGLQISDVHPRSGYAIDPETEHYLLLGDETALPAIGAILDALPAHASAQVFAQVSEASAEQMLSSRAALSVNWSHRDIHVPDSLLEAARSMAIQANATAIWVAAESGQVAAIRRLLIGGRDVDKARLSAAGYWKRGEADHRDEEG